MTVQSNVFPISYVGNDSTSTYYPITGTYNEANDIGVTVRETATGEETNLTYGTGFTVDANGVKTTTAWDENYTVVIRRTTDITQGVDYQPNDAFPAETHEAVCDKLTMICQELRAELDRAFRLSFSADSQSRIPATTDEIPYINSSGEFITMTVAETLAWLNAYTGAGASDYSDIQNVTTDSLLGRDTAGTGVAELITLGRGLTMVAGALTSGGIISVSFLTGSSASRPYNSGASCAILIGCGGGGAGGGADLTTEYQGCSGKGGNSGSWVIHFVNISGLSSKVGNFGVGAAGVGVTGGTGGDGGNSTYSDDSGASIVVYGGNGGNIVGPTKTFYAEQSYSTTPTQPTGATINIRGRRGGSGTVAYNFNVTDYLSCISGEGAPSIWGPGGPAVFTNAETDAGGTNGIDGFGYGSGGSGAISHGGNTAGRIGGNGKGGAWLIIESK